MQYDEFKKLVREMRDAQKAFFTTRNGKYLITSKELERKVDAVIYPSLFN